MQVDKSASIENVNDLASENQNKEKYGHVQSISNVENIAAPKSYSW